MRFVGFIGPSYTLSSVNVDCQRCVNLYPELDEIGTGKDKEVASLVSTPGLSLLATIGSGPIRCIFTASNGSLFVASGNTVYQVSSSWVGTAIGMLTTSTGEVSMADNGFQLAIVDGTTSGFYWEFTSSTFGPIPFPSADLLAFSTAFTGSDQVVYQDDVFIFNQTGTSQFFISDQLAITFNTILPKIASIEGPGAIVAILSDHRDLWLFGIKMTEVWFDSGISGAFPFERIQGAFVEQGCAAKFSIAKMNNTVFWLGSDDKGNGVVYMAQGYQPQRISTHAVEKAIQSYGDISGAVAYTYQQNGHHFYVVNFAGASTSWVFDTTTKLWHERVFTNNGLFERHRADCHAFAFSKHIVGDYQNGNLYELSQTTFSDNGQAITRMRVSPHVSQDMARVTYENFQLDVEAGTGLDGVGQGTNPQVMMQFSDDGGHSFSNEKWASIGAIGQRKARAIWRRLGMSRDRVFKVVITDPVKVAILGAEINAIAGES